MDQADRNAKIPFEKVLSHSGKMAALEDVYREHGDWLRHLIGRRLRVQPAEADDIVQEAYLRLALREPGEVRRPKALLSQIALNLFRDSRRRRAVRDDYARAQQPETGASPFSGLADQEAGLEIERIVLALPEPQRDVFVLSRFRHMSNKEIAEHLGLSIKTVEWRMSRALNFCISRLQD